MTYLILLLSLTALILGADILVRGSVNLASAMGVSTLVIGLTLVAWGTSAPELVVSLTAGLQNEYGIALGNIIGSNLANILLIGGLGAFLIPLSTHGMGLRFNAILLLLVSLILAIMVASGYLNPIIGFALLGIKVFMLYQSFRGHITPTEEVTPESMSLMQAALMTLGGAVLVGAGGFALVESATALAHAWHIPSAIIGLSVVAIGTSLPELAATIAAARQRQGDLILGNIIGSNLANILIVLGFTSLLAPGRIYGAGHYGSVVESYAPVLLFLMVVTLALTAFVFLKRPLNRLTGLIFMIVYGIFILGSFFAGGDL